MITGREKHRGGRGNRAKKKKLKPFYGVVVRKREEQLDKEGHLANKMRSTILPSRTLTHRSSRVRVLERAGKKSKSEGGS